jgi:hypothetical protein
VVTISANRRRSRPGTASSSTTTRLSRGPPVLNIPVMVGPTPRAPKSCSSRAAALTFSRSL